MKSRVIILSTFVTIALLIFLLLPVVSFPVRANNPRLEITPSLSRLLANGSRTPSGQIRSASGASNLAFLPFVSTIPTPTPPPFTEMLLIPAGVFEMGCDSAIDNCGGVYFNGYAMELPLHFVNLRTYYIDKYKVTNARYAACVAAGACYAPSGLGSQTRAHYYDDPAYAYYPVLYVSWYSAEQFCTWEGKRLPTEAQWEKAARGSMDTRRYPWGNTEPNCTQANVRLLDNALCVGDTTAVDSYPNPDTSPYGALDMSGNAWEWVNDWYQEDYYSYSPYDDPQGPSQAMPSSSCNYCRVVRSGSWWFTLRYARTSYRGRLNPWTESNSLGFRCAR